MTEVEVELWTDDLNEHYGICVLGDQVFRAVTQEGVRLTKKITSWMEPGSIEDIPFTGILDEQVRLENGEE